jgi:uncharacterized integral membrane protein
VRSIGRFVIALLVGIAVVFAVVNRAPITLNLWPLPYVAEAPLYLVLIATLALGVIAGGVAAWLGGARWRRRARDAARESESLRRRVEALERDRAAAPAALPARRYAPHMDDE